MIKPQSHKKILSGYARRFHRIFEICQQQQDGSLLTGQIFQNVFKEPEAGNGIEGILTILDNNI